MSVIQKQELQIFSDHSVLSRHLFDNDTQCNLLMVTDTAGTSACWLVTALVEAASRMSGIPSPAKIIIGSFLNHKEFYTNMFDRLKIPPSSYHVLELAEDLVQKNAGKPADFVINDILKRFQQLSQGVPGSMVILDKPELLMALFGLHSDDLHLRLINPLTRMSSLLIAVSSVESFDNDMPENLGKDSVEFARFITSMFHKSFCVLSVRPLDTGKAKDVTGTLTVTRGGALLDTANVTVTENQYLFHTYKDSTTLFYR